jgi:ribose 5-phosphate isomerase RpiB
MFSPVRGRFAAETGAASVEVGVVGRATGHGMKLSAAAVAAVAAAAVAIK